MRARAKNSGNDIIRIVKGNIYEMESVISDKIGHGYEFMDRTGALHIVSVDKFDDYFEWAQKEPSLVKINKHQAFEMLTNKHMRERVYFKNVISYVKAQGKHWYFGDEDGDKSKGTAINFNTAEFFEEIGAENEHEEE